MDYVYKLNKLSEYMGYWIDTVEMTMPHKFYTYPEFSRDYFIESFTNVGFIVTKDTLYFRKKSFTEWLKLNQ